MSSRRRIAASVLFSATLLLGVAVSAAAEGDGIVRIAYFTSADCDNCAAVSADVLAPLLAERGDLVQIKVIDIYDAEAPGALHTLNYEMMLEAEQMFGVAAEDRGVPMLIVGGEVLIGAEEIRERLLCLIDTCQTVGGVPWPEIAGLEEIAPVDELEAGSTSGLDPWRDDIAPCEDGEDGGRPVITWAAYFYEVGCQECSRVEYVIRYAQSVHVELVVEEYNVHEDTALAEWLGDEYGLPEEHHLATPAIFVGEDYLIGNEITEEALLALADKYALGGSERVWAEADPEEATEGILDRFKSFGALTVALAGLIDGLNPCAFATLVFLISYLTVLGREGKSLLAVGVSFTLGVFVTYVLVGLGLWRALSTIPFLADAGRWLYAALAVVCLALAAVSFSDYLKARRGELKEMTLAMPESLRRRVHAVIRRASGARTLALAAFPTGAAISLLELACTGQVYLPTIMFVVRVPEMQAQAVWYLLLYNLLFIVPLVVVFLLVYFGATSLQLGVFLRKNAAAVKLATTLLFVALGAWLVFSVVS